MHHKQLLKLPMLSLMTHRTAVSREKDLLEVEKERVSNGVERMKTKNKMHPQTVEASNGEADDLPDSSQKRKVIARGEGWKKSEPYTRHIQRRSPPPLLANSNPELITMTPLQMFDIIFTLEMFEHMKKTV